MCDENQGTMRFTIITFAGIMVILIAYSVVTCSKEEQSTEDDKATVLLDALHFSMNDYLETHGQFPEYVQAGQTAKTFIPTLKLNFPYLEASSIKPINIILTSISHEQNKYVISIKLYSGKIISINEQGKITNSAFLQTKPE